jgi:hypothetical protein
MTAQELLALFENHEHVCDIDDCGRFVIAFGRAEKSAETGEVKAWTTFITFESDGRYFIDHQ